MLERLRDAIEALLGKNESDEAEGYPFTINLSDGLQHYAEKYVLLTDADWHVVGIKWGTAKWGVREFHGTGFTILFNPKFHLSEPVDIEPPEDVYHG